MALVKTGLGQDASESLLLALSQHKFVAKQSKRSLNTHLLGPMFAELKAIEPGDDAAQIYTAT